MLTLQKTGGCEIASSEIDGQNIDELLSKEWLVSNNRGGYASSSIIGCNTRRYHGLLVGSLRPPTNRIMGLSHCLEMLIFGSGNSGGKKSRNVSGSKLVNLSTLEFEDTFAPEGYGYITRFRQDFGVHFDYKLDKASLTKSLYLLRDSDTIALEYDFTRVVEPLEFILRPFVCLRDFHSLQKSYSGLNASQFGNGILVRNNVPQSSELFINCPCTQFEEDAQWWFNFLYRKDKERGQDFTEDLWTPGFFRCRLLKPGKIVLWANLSGHCNPDFLMKSDIEFVREQLQKEQNKIIASAKTKDNQFRNLCLAADSFVVKRQTKDAPHTTILAGFPWFADWGRDAFIALPGLLLCTGRFEEAKSVLVTFSEAADKGMIPNRFDDYSGKASFNSIDASLWFINAAFQYLYTSGDSETFEEQLLSKIRWIVDSYYNGTRFDIHADEDGLITGGDKHSQLTWMDTKYHGEAFTPRYGKAVEINALWYNALCSLGRFYTQTDTKAAEHYHSLADRVETGFRKLFWNENKGYLNDCVLPDGTVDSSLRPNQIFAVSLPFSALSIQQQTSVVEAVQKNLLTPLGLRTLNPQDSNYIGTYTGSQLERDHAYHQGTVWPYLIGHFVEAYLKVNNFSKQSKADASEFIKPLLEHMTVDGCLGQLCEIFDGDGADKAKGCFAQAWSVGELIRAYQLINS